MTLYFYVRDDSVVFIDCVAYDMSDNVEVTNS